MISLERLKTKTGMAWMQKNKDKKVMIHSGECGLYWRPNRSGYTYLENEAGVYTLADAYDASGHCGRGKCISYKLCSREITQEPRGKAKLLLSIAS